MPQNFSGQDLRGRSFKGQDLSGANFSYADIRSTNFTNGTLRGANFRGVKAGLQYRWVVGLVLVAWLMSGVSGIFSLLTAALLVSFLQSSIGHNANFISAVVCLVTLAIFFIFTVRDGLVAGLRGIAVAFAIAFAVAFAVVFGESVIGTLARVVPAAFPFAFTVALAVVGGVAFAVAFTVVGAISVAVAVAVALVFPFAFTVAFTVVGAVAVAVAVACATVLPLPFAFPLAVAVTTAVAVAFGVVFTVAVARARNRAVAVAFTVAFTVAVAVVVAVVIDGVGVFPAVEGFSLMVAINATMAFSGAGAFGFAVAVAVAVAVALLGAYIGWRGLAGDEKHAWVRQIAIAFAAIGGTSFRDADLTDADFTRANLKSTDFRKATLKRTRFYEAQKLDYARVGSSILANQAVLKLLVHCNGREKSYEGANLRGANLVDADLTEANLKNANLSEATFEGASLDRANLTLAQAVGTNFAMARMTGACIEAWNIESTTVLDNVDCRFIYLLEKSKPGTDDRERRPSSGEFAPGEFTKLFEEALDTVDLIFRNGIDWKAFVAAFKKVQVKYEDTELTIQSIENKGDGVVIVKIAVPPTANKENIHTDFTQSYDFALKAIEKQYKAQLKDKDEQIQLFLELFREKNADMTEITKLLASQSNITQNIVTAEKNSMSENFNNDLSKANVANFTNKNQDNARQQANQYNYAPEQKQNLAEAAAEIQQLLKQLDSNNSTATKADKQVIAINAIHQEIKCNPTFKARLLNALKEGGLESLKVLFAPIGIPIEMVKGWLEAE